MANHPALTAIHEATISYLQSTSTNAVNAHELEDAVDVLLATVHRAAAETVSKWNARTDDIWRRLPAELYAECFKHLEMKDKLAVTHTSRLWRKNALSIPTLWSTIHTTGSFEKDQRLVQTMLHRSAFAALSLMLSVKIADDPTTFDMLKKNVRRVKSLVVTYSGGGDFMDALLPPPQAPLPRLETLELSDANHWQHPSRSLSVLFPNLRSLRITERFTGMFHPMPHLEDLSCAFTPRTDGRRIFHLCPSLRTLTIIQVDPSERIAVKMLPQGRPPAFLRSFKLNDTSVDGTPELAPFFGPWAGHTGLRHLKLLGVGVQFAAAVALCSSIYAGPRGISISSSDHFLWQKAIEIVLHGDPDNDDIPRFVLDGAGTPDALLDVFVNSAHHLANLTFLYIPGYLFEDMLVNGTITLPAVTDIRIWVDLADPRGGFYGSRIARLLALDLDSMAGLRAPRLQYFTFNTYQQSSLPDIFAFARRLPKAVRYEAPRLKCLIFSGGLLRNILERTSGRYALSCDALKALLKDVAIELGHIIGWSTFDWPAYDRITPIQVPQ